MHRYELVIVYNNILLTELCVLAVHGFRQNTFNVDEGDRLDTEFALNVVGTTQFQGLVATGTITAEADGSAS